eukprot:953403-Pleurochrysis_carterae.AAC.3
MSGTCLCARHARVCSVINYVGWGWRDAAGQESMHGRGIAQVLTSCAPVRVFVWVRACASLREGACRYASARNLSKARASIRLCVRGSLVGERQALSQLFVYPANAADKFVADISA